MAVTLLLPPFPQELPAPRRHGQAEAGGPGWRPQGSCDQSRELLSEDSSFFPSGAHRMGRWLMRRTFR